VILLRILTEGNFLQILTKLNLLIQKLIGSAFKVLFRRYPVVLQTKRSNMFLSIKKNSCFIVKLLKINWRSKSRTSLSKVNSSCHGIKKTAARISWAQFLSANLNRINLKTYVVFLNLKESRLTKWKAISQSCLACTWPNSLGM
jgi:hypothetical protein